MNKENWLLLKDLGLAIGAFILITMAVNGLYWVLTKIGIVNNSWESEYDGGRPAYEQYEPRY